MCDFLLVFHGNYLILFGGFSVSGDNFTEMFSAN